MRAYHAASPAHSSHSPRATYSALKHAMITFVHLRKPASVMRFSTSGAIEVPPMAVARKASQAQYGIAATTSVASEPK